MPLRLIIAYAMIAVMMTGLGWWIWRATEGRREYLSYNRALKRDRKRQRKMSNPG